MKKYLFIIKATEGCDYSINCGIDYIEIEEKDIIRAYKKVREAYGIECDFKIYDRELQDIRCYDITNSVYTSFDNLKNELKEYNEYLKLKKKYTGYLD